jgi:hypothetical protein
MRQQRNIYFRLLVKMESTFNPTGFKIIFTQRHGRMASNWPRARSVAWVLAARLLGLGSWIRIPLEVWMFVFVLLCCVVLSVITLEAGESTCAYNPERRETGKQKRKEKHFKKCQHSCFVFGMSQVEISVRRLVILRFLWFSSNPHGTTVFAETLEGVTQRCSNP